MSEQREAIENAIWDAVDEGTFDHSVNAANVVAAIIDAILALPQGPVGWRDGPDWKGFGQALVEDWPTADIDGSFLFDMALKHRVIREIPGGYNPEQHIDAEGICPEPGDPWYEYVPECAPGQPKQPSVAEAARVRLLAEVRAYLALTAHIDDAKTEKEIAHNVGVDTAIAAIIRFGSLTQEAE